MKSGPTQWQPTWKGCTNGMQIMSQRNYPKGFQPREKRRETKGRCKYGRNL